MYDSARPVGVLADAFFTKAQYTPEQLFAEIAELIDKSPIRPQVAKSGEAPVWFARSTTGYYVLTCPQCLRSFSVPEESTPSEEVLETECFFCQAGVRYMVERNSGTQSQPRQSTDNTTQQKVRKKA